MKIGVIGHTLQVASLQDLPPRARLGLADVDLVLHVGNIGNLSFLRDLQDSFGLVFAVHGDQDSKDVNRYLDSSKVVRFANRKIGITFGHHIPENTTRILPFKRTGGDAHPNSLSEQLLSQFETVDCIVFGNPENSLNHVHQGTLIFNPGQLVSSSGQPGTMGLLDVTDKAIMGRIIQL
ncbi:MAG: metallophosphoesterase family protein [Chloroflexota bacterium]